MRFSRSIMFWGVAVVVCVGLAAWAPAADEAGRALKQAKLALGQGDDDVAIAHLNEAVRLEPKQAMYRGLRGTAYLRQGNYAKGIADLKAATELNPGDAGLHYQPTSTAKLSTEAIEHGRRQVARMLHDRPAMNQHGKETIFLRRWAERKFAGEDFGEKIDWDPSPPLHSDAEHLAPDGDDHATVLIEEKYTEGPKKGGLRSFEELWAGAVYELHNVTYAREFVRLHDEAAEGQLSKKAFVAGILKYELLAAQRTRAFYVQAFLPWVEKKKLPTDPKLWFCDWWASSESVLHGFTDKSSYPWRPYAWEHDWATVHRYWRCGKLQKALKLLRRMRTEQGYDEDQPDVRYWIGSCLSKLDKPTEAVAAFTESLRLDPQSAAAYRARGEQYKKLGEKAKAAADLARAKELEGAE